MIMGKPISLDSVELAMLQELAKKSHQKPDQYLKNLIHQMYGKNR